MHVQNLESHPRWSKTAYFGPFFGDSRLIVNIVVIKEEQVNANDDQVPYALSKHTSMRKQEYGIKHDDCAKKNKHPMGCENRVGFKMPIQAHFFDGRFWT